MAKEAEGSVRKRKAGDDVGTGSSAGDEGESPAIPETSLSEVVPKSSEEVALSSNPNPGDNFLFEDEYSCLRSCVDDADILRQYSDIRAEEAAKIPYVGDKEPLSSLADEFQSGSPILQEKIKLLGEQYTAIRRTRGDGNCFYRSFMYSYLEHILETQDRIEVDRILANIELCKKTLQGLGYADFTFEDFFSIFIEQLQSVLQGSEVSIRYIMNWNFCFGQVIKKEELLKRSRDQSISDYVVMFFRFVTSGEIRRRTEFFEPFIAGLSNTSVDQFCKASVEPMGEESDHVHIIALSDALGVPIRVVYLDRSSYDLSSPTINHHDFVPNEGSISDPARLRKARVTLLYRPGHYDILYPK